ncbi:uncharacterized protein LOC121779048 [Salvia splendens]|uniref:uncharacterized protein LOC121779048 n=1 Tax=Salvia splendens TaxID=180675 RepID=UPI001C275C64|nr:uncharacterized protein LOC121779048 [Salvia splendens]
MVNNLVSSQQHMQNNMQSNNDVVHKLQDAQVEQQAAMDMLEKQLYQIATSLSEMCRNEGRIPASVKPPDRANVSQITLRSGREYEGPTMKIDEGMNQTPLEKETETGEARTKDDIQNRDFGKPVPQAADPLFSDPGAEVEVEEIRKEAGESSKGDVSNKANQVKPFPYRGEVKKKKDDLVDFMEIFSKFIKEFITGKTKPNGKIVIGETVSVVIQKRRMSSKRTDPGASINVLPLSIYKKLERVRMVYTKVVIQLADRSCISPEGVLENVIVKVHDFLYPADFHVIKMSEYESAESSGVLLGRPFLRTAKTIIDVFDGTICLDYHGEKFTFNIDEAMKKPLDVENMHVVDIIKP